MTTPDLFNPEPGTRNPEPALRARMNGKPVHHVPAKSVLNLHSHFGKKLLCDGLTFSAGSACAYSCSFCYVPDLMRKSSRTFILYPLSFSLSLSFSLLC